MTKNNLKAKQAKIVKRVTGDISMKTDIGISLAVFNNISDAYKNPSSYDNLPNFDVSFISSRIAYLIKKANRRVTKQYLVKASKWLPVDMNNNDDGNQEMLKRLAKAKKYLKLAEQYEGKIVQSAVQKARQVK